MIPIKPRGPKIKRSLAKEARIEETKNSPQRILITPKRAEKRDPLNSSSLFEKLINTKILFTQLTHQGQVHLNDVNRIKTKRGIRCSTSSSRISNRSVKANIYRIKYEAFKEYLDNNFFKPGDVILPEPERGSLFRLPLDSDMEMDPETTKPNIGEERVFSSVYPQPLLSQGVKSVLTHRKLMESKNNTKPTFLPFSSIEGYRYTSRQSSNERGSSAVLRQIRSNKKEKLFYEKYMSQESKKTANLSREKQKERLKSQCRSGRLTTIKSFNIKTKEEIIEKLSQKKKKEIFQKMFAGRFLERGDNLDSQLRAKKIARTVQTATVTPLYKTKQRAIVEQEDTIGRRTEELLLKHTNSTVYAQVYRNEESSSPTPESREGATLNIAELAGIGMNLGLVLFGGMGSSIFRNIMMLPINKAPDIDHLNAETSLITGEEWVEYELQRTDDTPASSIALTSHTSVCFKDMLICFGGELSERNILKETRRLINTVFCIDLIHLTYKTIKTRSFILPSQRRNHSACRMGGTMVITGGIGIDLEPLNDLYIFSVSNFIDLRPSFIKMDRIFSSKKVHQWR